jgi:hypothetical protein
MSDYQAIAWPLHVIVYGEGREIAKIDRGPHQSYGTLTILLADHGFTVVGEWSTRKIRKDKVHFATVRNSQESAFRINKGEG